MPLMSVKLKNRILAVNPALEVSFQNIRINGEARGCSGFVRNPENGRIAYVNTEGSSYGPLAGKILYRDADSLTDYSGGMNRWSTPDVVAQDVADLIR